MAEQIGSEDFEAKVLQSDKPVLIDFFATWCGPCKMMAPVIDEVAAEKAGAVDVYKVDVDDCPDIAQRYGIMSIPTFIVFRGGEAVSQALGVQSKGNILALLD